MSLLEKIKAGTGNKKTIKFPGTDQDVALKVLSTSEIQEADFATERLFKKESIDTSMSTVDAYEDEKTTQLLFRALRDPEDESKNLAKDIDEFRKQITRDEKDILVEAYVAFEKECSPSPDNMTEEEMETLMDELKKRPEEIAGGVLNISIARRLIISLVNQLQTSQKLSGSISS